MFPQKKKKNAAKPATKTAVTIPALHEKNKIYSDAPPFQLVFDWHEIMAAKSQSLRSPLQCTIQDLSGGLCISVNRFSHK